MSAGEVSDNVDVPIFSVGIIADIQYAPIPDGASFSGNPRYYRHSLLTAKHAAEHFERDQVDLMINLGDILDGKCQKLDEHGGDAVPAGQLPSDYALKHVLDSVAAYTGRIIHTYGNHCLYNFDRKSLQEKLGIPFVVEPCGELVGYSSHVHKGIKFVILDSYDEAIMKRCTSKSKKREAAIRVLRENNPNFTSGSMNDPTGLNDLEKRFVGFNGGVGELQLQWLRSTLEEARLAKEKVVILSHQPIMPGSSNPVCLIWNYAEVLSILREFSDVVVASLAGHAHKGGYVKDKSSGIHFRVIEAALESKPERTYCILDIHHERLELRGFGKCESATFDFTCAIEPCS